MYTNLYPNSNNYKKALVRLENNLQSGRFASYTRQKKQQVWKRLCRYARQLGITIKAPIAAACLAAGLCFAKPAAAQPTFTVQAGAANPFNGVDIGGFSKPAFTDIDGDGDMDAFFGETSGTIFYYKNTGSSAAPVFTVQAGAANPFNGVDIGSFSAPAFADIDNDGDMDAFIGLPDGTIVYYKNTGTPIAPVFTVQAGAANPFNGVDVGLGSSPIFTDIDGDGDKDAFIGEGGGTIRYYKNTGSSVVPVFTVQAGAANPFNGVDVGLYSSPAFADMDGDGDMDAIIGETIGLILYYKNTGTPIAPVFTVQTGAANPFNGVDVGAYSAPAFVNIDGDGDIDVFVGVQTGTISFYKNTTASGVQPSFVAQIAGANPFNTVDAGDNSKPSFVDIDSDGDMDAFIGVENGNIVYYKNNGTALVPVFALQGSGLNPLSSVTSSYAAAPAFADIDGDGDKDVFIGNSYGTIDYFKNTGTALAAVFTLQSGGLNPLNGASTTGQITPAFADIDRDGDMDAFVGGGDGTILFYKNTGTVLAAVFTSQTGGLNPLNLFDVGLLSAPSFADIDNDGDKDALVGANDGTISYFKNTGTILAPVFAQQTSTANPFNGVNSGSRAVPAFVNSDGDNDIDVFVGRQDGAIDYYLNTNLSTLPLNLLSFSGNRQAGYNQLQWQTADEVNTKLFEIERSADGRSFTLIASLITNNTPGNNSYNIKDNVVYDGKLFYRLKMIDIDGRFTYSNIIWISSELAVGVTIYPNPVKDVININTGNARVVKTKATIYDVSGRLMQSVLISNSQQQVNVKALAKGMYSIQFADGTVQRFMKE
ncbi:MAG: T9SS type A sorting domain-containing protein [Chitinophagaceae bacterium]